MLLIYNSTFLFIFVGCAEREDQRGAEWGGGGAGWREEDNKIGAPSSIPPRSHHHHHHPSPPPLFPPERNPPPPHLRVVEGHQTLECACVCVSRTVSLALSLPSRLGVAGHAPTCQGGRPEPPQGPLVRPFPPVSEALFLPGTLPSPSDPTRVPTSLSVSNKFSIPPVSVVSRCRCFQCRSVCVCVCVCACLRFFSFRSPSCLHFCSLSFGHFLLRLRQIKRVAVSALPVARVGKRGGHSCLGATKQNADSACQPCGKQKRQASRRNQCTGHSHPSRALANGIKNAGTHQEKINKYKKRLFTMVLILLSLRFVFLRPCPH